MREGESTREMTGLKARSARVILAVAIASALMLASVPSALGVHHLVRISEVFPGEAGALNAEFVELQLTAANENFVTATSVRIYGATGAESVPPPSFGSNPANGENQRTILVGTPAAETLFSVQNDLDYADADRIDPAGGAVCFYSNAFPGVDCVSWGTFNPMTALPSAHAPSEPGTIPDGSSLTRDITRGCATLHDNAQLMIDDTDNSSADFFDNPSPNPRNNAGAITESACALPGVFTPPGNPASPINPAGNVRKRKCKKKSKGRAGAAKKKCKKRRK